MSCSSCGSPIWKVLSRAAAKSASSRFRNLGLLRVQHDWVARATVCEKCPMRVVLAGTSYCGKPFTQQIQRDPATQGCGCPTIPKAKDPNEHCPIDSHYQPAKQSQSTCTCRWCAATPASNTNAA